MNCLPYARSAFTFRLSLIVILVVLVEHKNLMQPPSSLQGSEWVERYERNDGTKSSKEFVDALDQVALILLGSLSVVVRRSSLSSTFRRFNKTCFCYIHFFCFLPLLSRSIRRCVSEGAVRTHNTCGWAFCVWLRVNYIRRYSLFRTNPKRALVSFLKRHF